MRVEESINYLPDTVLLYYLYTGLLFEEAMMVAVCILVLLFFSSSYWHNINLQTLRWLMHYAYNLKYLNISLVFNSNGTLLSIQ